MKDYYTILGIPANERAEGIKQAFKQKAKMYHPDVCKLPDAHQRFIDVAEAYEILRNPATRAHYDSIINPRRSGAYTDMSGFAQHQQKAEESAKQYSTMSLEDVLLLFKLITKEIGRTVLWGVRDKPVLRLGDYVRMGFLGMLLLIGIILSMTGIGLLPGAVMVYYAIKSFIKNDKFIGIAPVVLSTIGLIIVLSTLSWVLESQVVRQWSHRGWTSLNNGYDRVVLLIRSRTSPDAMVERFFQALAHGDVGTTQHLLDRGVSPRVGYQNKSAIIVAARSGSTTLVKLLLDKGANVDGEEFDEFSTPLSEAAWNGDIEMARLLLDKGARLVFATGFGNALGGAVSNNQRAMVEFLLSRGAEIDLPSEHSMTPLMAAAFNGHVEIVKYLISKGAELNRVTKDSFLSQQDLTARGIAELRGHAEIAEIIRKAGGK